MRMRFVVLIGLAALLTIPQASAQGVPQAGTVIRCESSDGRTRECRAPVGRAVLQRQLSRAACIEGRSWGQSPDGIWVSQGCRAEFLVLPWGRPGNTGLVRCESEDGRYRRCALPGRGRAVLVRQLSKSACIEGRSWGDDRGAVWVDQGCRGEFSVERGRGRWDDDDRPGSSGRVFRCESSDGRYIECAAETRRGVQLLRQLSKAACIEGRSWGYGRGVVWVAQGCRAEFRSF